MEMRLGDRVLQTWRSRVARAWIRPGGCVLDIGCHQGEFLDSLGTRIASSVGIDPLAVPRAGRRHTLLSESFRESLPFPDQSFDAIVMLATLEHIRDKPPLGRECRRILRADGRLIVTVPSPRVDAIVAVLRRVCLVDGMSLEQHHGFDPCGTEQIFDHAGFFLEHRSRFQLGLNYLFVFRPRPTAPGAPVE
jgi:SAM-dependent methyltransferase